MPVSNLVFGTVQLGDAYGLANTAGMPDDETATELIHRGVNTGIRCFDTARGYGESEARIGRALSTIDYSGDVITKLRPPMDFTEETSKAEIADFVESEVALSREHLRMDVLDCVLLHRARHLIEWDGTIWQVLRRLQAEGLIKRLGVSVQNIEETERSLATPGVEHIQLAHNILDWRWREAGMDKELAAREDVTVHARSVYLQGLLVAEKSSLFPVLEEAEAQKVIEMERTLARDLGRQSLADLCLSYIRSLTWIDGVVLGMETMEQLEDNLALFGKEPLTEEERRLVETKMPRLPEKLLSPGLWYK